MVSNSLIGTLTFIIEVISSFRGNQIRMWRLSVSFVWGLSEWDSTVYFHCLFLAFTDWPESSCLLPSSHPSSTHSPPSPCHLSLLHPHVTAITSPWCHSIPPPTHLFINHHYYATWHLSLHHHDVITAQIIPLASFPSRAHLFSPFSTLLSKLASKHSVSPSSSQQSVVWCIIMPSDHLIIEHCHIRGGGIL